LPSVTYNAHAAPVCPNGLTAQEILLPLIPEDACISLTGMAGAGKTTVGKALARLIGRAFADSDHIIEAAYAVPLQTIADSLGKDAFLDLEGRIVSQLDLKHCVLATGGSVIYREAAMRHLISLGPVIHLDVPLEVCLERIARHPDRGIAIAPGQTLEELFAERAALYRRWATFSIDVTDIPPDDCAAAIVRRLNLS